MKIALVGFAACGKTAAGKILAQKLGLKFFDTDKVAEKLLNMTISQAFCLGEEVFRRAECEAIASAPENCVVSCGGGLPENAPAAEFLKDCTVVFIKRDVDILIPLLQSDPSRPLYYGKSADEIKAIYARRLPLYEKYATFAVSSDGNAEKLASDVLSRLSE